MTTTTYAPIAAPTARARRTARKDCCFVIYEWQSRVEGQSYIGLTRKTENSPLQSAWKRWQKHESRAIHEPEKDWPIYRHLREPGNTEGWRLVVIEVVRGRAEAYARERVIVKERRPTLNMQYVEGDGGSNTEGEEAA